MSQLISLQTFINHSRNAIILMAPKGDILFKNPAFEKLFTSNQPSISEIFNHNKIILYHIQNLLKTRGSLYLREMAVTLFDQTEINMDIEMFPLTNEQGELYAAGIIFYNRAESAPFEEHQKRLDRVNYLGTIASGLAHEIKNPLSGIKGASQLLSKSLQKDHELLEYAHIIQTEAVRVDRLVKALLNFTKPRKLSKKKCNINQILHELIKLQKTVDSKISFVAEFDPSLPQIDADSEFLTQAFLNLIKNARQSITNKGQVTIRSRVVTDYTLKKNKKRKQVIGIDVEDTGAGMSLEALKKIFVPFFTTKTQGTGLGLALCHQIIEEHEGDIQVKSEVGKGTKFSVYLPV